ncbi:MAG: MBL fold metallo-hydrolase [Clostridia bacterium]|nr:MBL fold metallo-hydrolase [Clostridia bacterium]
MKITWLGHACFKIESEGYSVVIDPFDPEMLPWLPAVNTTADRVLCSHGHGDHNYTAAVEVKASGAAPLRVEEIATWHDDENGTLRGPNTMFILEGEGLRVAHVGDLGCMPNVEQLEKLKNLDVLCIPVGGYYTINAEMAKQIVSAVEPRVVIPMHYKGKGFGFPVLGSVEQFTNRFCSSTVQWYNTNEIEVTADTSYQVAVLTCPLK